MKIKNKNSKLTGGGKAHKGQVKNQGYPLYPDDEDIYIKGKKEKDINLDNNCISETLNKKEKFEKNNEKDFKDDVSGSDLDIPGSELDDVQENIGSEDEENNYYSLGGDGHYNLEENNGE